ncbi:MAG: proline dehydrogenase family protein [Candidatus Riflebacteria bacterium]
MNSDMDRWALQNIDEALKWLEFRRQQGIAVALDALGEYAQSPAQAKESLDSYKNCLLSLPGDCKNVAVAIKLSAIGLNFNLKLAQENLRQLIDLARKTKNLIEIDIEGTPTVEATIAMACKFAEKGDGLVLALQAYLDRTQADIQRAVKAGLKVRLVKGAYRGDSEDFKDIQNRFLQCFKSLLETGRPFDVDTHDPVLLEKMKAEIKNKGQVCFGFLKGLADQTKLDLVKSGYAVSEYVPYGANRKAYEMRRQLYLKNLEKTGLSPAL